MTQCVWRDGKNRPRCAFLLLQTYSRRETAANPADAVHRERVGKATHHNFMRVSLSRDMHSEVFWYGSANSTYRQPHQHPTTPTPGSRAVMYTGCR